MLRKEGRREKRKRRSGRCRFSFFKYKDAQYNEINTSPHQHRLINKHDMVSFLKPKNFTRVFHLSNFQNTNTNFKRGD